MVPKDSNKLTSTSAVSLTTDASPATTKTVNATVNLVNSSNTTSFHNTQEASLSTHSSTIEKNITSRSTTTTPPHEHDEHKGVKDLSPSAAIALAIVCLVLTIVSC